MHTSGRIDRTDRIDRIALVRLRIAHRRCVDVVPQYLMLLSSSQHPDCVTRNALIAPAQAALA